MPVARSIIPGTCVRWGMPRPFFCTVFGSQSLERIALVLATGVCLLPAGALSQDSAEQGTNMRGSRAEIAVTVRDRSRQVVTVPMSIRLLRNGAVEEQRSTTQGRAFFILRGLGDYAIGVEAAGFKATQKEVSVSVAIQYEEDVYLDRDPSGAVSGVPGRAVLAPKAKEALDKSTQALMDGKLDEAEKYIAEAMKLAPSNPDVLYVRGMLFMRQGNWEQAEGALAKASHMDPNNARFLGALGMDLVNQKKFAEAIPPLQKSIQLQPVSGWETQWALAKAYYSQEQYDQALRMADQAHLTSHGSSGQAELLLAQCLTVLGRYEDSAQVLREFVKYNAASPDAATARHWLDRLTADGKIRR